MKKVTIPEAIPYEGVGHFKCTTLRLQGKEETGITKFSVGLSHFLPGGGAEMRATPTEKVYICMEGEITVKTEDETIILKPTETLFVGANEARSIVNDTNRPASMYVIINY